MTSIPQSKRPARYRKTIYAAIHYLFWSLMLMILWPISLIFRGVEKLHRHD
ncbi:MAG: hypothetical protein ABIE07_06455 [Candidatus Zixiibacteriota bacterium]